MVNRAMSVGVLALLVFAANAIAQPSSNSSANWVTAGPIYATARSGNTVYLGGVFNAIAPRSQQIGAFGQFVTAPGRRSCAAPPVNGIVNAVVSDGFGGFFIGGRFDRVGASDRQNLVHMLATCVIDTSWSGMVRGTVNALSYSGGVLYVGGLFAEAGQQGGGVVARSNLAAFSSSGVLTMWDPSANGEVFALEAYSFYGATSQTDVFTGGAFTQIGGAARQRLAAVDATGAATTFSADADGPVYALDVDPQYPSGPPLHVWVGGNFTTIGGSARSRIAVVTIATNTVEAFNPGANAAVRAIAMAGSTLSNATVYVGGDFTQVGGGTKNYMAAISAAGLALSFAAEPDGPVYALAFDYAISPTAVYAGGRFTRLGGVTRLNAGRVNATTGVAQDWNPAFDGAVRAIVVAIGYPSNRVGVGGEFDAIGAEPRRNLAAINLDTGALVPFSPDINGAVNAITLRSDVLYVGGAFTRVNGQTRNRLAAFAAGTRALTAWDPNADGAVNALIWSADTVFAGGDFVNIGSSPRGRVAAIDANTGTVRPWTPPDFNAAVDALAFVSADNLLYAGGRFTSVGGVPAPYLTRVSTTTGLRDLTWLPVPDGEVRAICIDTGVVYAGGVFTMMGTAPRTNLAAVNTTIGAATTWQPDPDGAVNALSCSSQAIYAGGAFTTVGTGTAQQTRPRLAGLLPSATGPTGTYATSFVANEMGVVEDALQAYDGVIAVGSGTPKGDENDPVARFAFFPLNFAGSPGAPVTPSVAVFSTSVRLRWSPPTRGPRPTAYLVYAGTGPGLNNLAAGFRVTSPQLDVTAPLGIAAYVRIAAVNSAGTSGPSEELSFVVNNVCTAPPDPPKELIASVTDGDVTFTWSLGSGEAVTSQRLEAGLARGRSDFVFPLAATDTTFAASAPPGVFYARLRSVGLCGTSVPSSEVVLVTGGVAAPPTAPLDFVALVGANNTVSVSWSAPATGTATSYRLEAGSGPGASDIASFTTTSTSLTFANVPSGTYYLRVFAIGATGTSPASDEFILVVP